MDQLNFILLALFFRLQSLQNYNQILQVALCFSKLCDYSVCLGCTQSLMGWMKTNNSRSELIRHRPNFIRLISNQQSSSRAILNNMQRVVNPLYNFRATTYFILFCKDAYLGRIIHLSFLKVTDLSVDIGFVSLSLLKIRLMTCLLKMIKALHFFLSITYLLIYDQHVHYVDGRRIRTVVVNVARVCKMGIFLVGAFKVLEHDTF